MAVTGEQTDSTKLFCENKIEEKDNGSDSISIGENRGNVYGCYFYVFHQKKRMVEKKRSRNTSDHLSMAAKSDALL